MLIVFMPTAGKKQMLVGFVALWTGGLYNTL